MHFYVQSKNCTLIIPERNNLNEASRLAILRPVRRIIENRSRSRLGKLYTVTDNVKDKARGLGTESAGGHGETCLHQPETGRAQGARRLRGVFEQVFDEHAHFMERSVGTLVPCGAAVTGRVTRSSA